MTVRDRRGLTIGEFGRRSGLSVKALRLYDISGPYPVHRRTVPATKVASIRRETDQQSLAGTIHESQWFLRDRLPGARVTAEHW